MPSLDDKQAITEVLFRYARAVDRKQLDEVADCYFPDANDNHGGYNGSISGLIDDMKLRHQTIDSSIHYITNVLIDFDDAGAAKVESYCLSYMRHSASDGAMNQSLSTISCRYVDRFECRSGIWKIADRIVVFDEVRNTTTINELPSTWVTARRDRTDLVFTDQP